MIVILLSFLFAHSSIFSLALSPKSCLPALRKTTRLSMNVFPGNEDEIVQILSKAGAAGVSFSVLAQRGGEQWEKIAPIFGKRLSELTPKFTPIENTYIAREGVDSALCRVRDRKSLLGHFYYLVLGPKGAGKSSLVANTFMNKKGAINVKIGNAGSPEAIVKEILSKCFIDAPTDTLDMNQLHDPLLKARESMKEPFNLIIELNMGSTDSRNLRTIKAAARSLAEYAKVILVLSDANAALSRMIGEPREKIIWVDAMTSAEALLLAKDIDIPLKDSELKEYFTKVGTLPIQIVDLLDDLNDGKLLEEIIAAAIKEAKDNLASFPLQGILARMKQYPAAIDAISSMEGLETEVLDGVSSSLFAGEVEDGVNLAAPEEVARKMNNVLMYHFPSREYRLTINALRTALRTYNPRILGKK